MNRKLVALVGSSLLSVMLLGACNNDDQNPPPEDNDTSEQIDENGTNDNAPVGNGNNEDDKVEKE